MQDLQVVIVGGTGSIGVATAELLSRHGARITITGRDAGKLASTATRVEGVHTRVCDVTEESSVARLFGAFDRVDHVVILAGSGGGGPVLGTPPAAQRFIIEERIWGPIHVVRAAVPRMRLGSITLASGLFSQRPPANGAILVAALAGVEGLARGLARELAPIRVNAVSFGVVRSNRHSGMGAEQQRYYDRLGSDLPTGRVGEPREAAQAVLFAMTNGYLTGEVLHVDGGARVV